MSSKKPLAMHPDGWAGRLFGVVMERLNMPNYRIALEMLAPQPGEAILEIGFGTGKMLELLANAAPGLSLAGVEPAPAMLARTQKRTALSSADLHLGTNFPLPFTDASFDAVCALNSFQFWPDPEQGVREVIRVLKPQGRLVLMLRDHGKRAPDWLPNPISKGGNEAADTMALLTACGFVDVQQPMQGSDSIGVIAKLP